MLIYNEPLILLFNEAILILIKSNLLVMVCCLHFEEVDVYNESICVFNGDPQVHSFVFSYCC